MWQELTRQVLKTDDAHAYTGDARACHMIMSFIVEIECPAIVISMYWFFKLQGCFQVPYIQYNVYTSVYDDNCVCVEKGDDKYIVLYFIVWSMISKWYMQGCTVISRNYFAPTSNTPRVYDQQTMIMLPSPIQWALYHDVDLNLLFLQQW